MSIQKQASPQPKQPSQTEKFHFPLRKIAVVLGGLSMLGSGSLYATEEEQKVITELRAEIARLKQELSAQKTTQASAPDGNTTPNSPVQSADAAPAETAEKSAQADEPVLLDAVVVRSRSRIEKLHDVPSSASVVTGEELNRELAQDLTAITKRGANITYNQNNTRGASLSIRGLGKGRSFQETQDPNVGITVDGVSYGLNQLGNFDFYDIDSVEVSRGPQGTLGGRGGSSGVVVINTKRPSFSPTADFSLTYGQREAIIAKTNVGGAVIDDLLAWRGSFVVDKARGYYVQGYDPNYSFYNKDRVSGRTQFLFTPTPDLTALLSYDFEPKAPQLQNGLTFYKDQPFTFVNGDPTDPSGTSARAKLAGFTSYTKIGGVYTPGTVYAGRDWFANRKFSSTSAQNYTYNYDANYIGNAINFNENQGQTVSNKGASVLLNWILGDHTLTSITGWRKYSFDAHNDEGTPFDINKNGGGGVFYSQYSEELKLSSNPGGWFDYTAGLFSMKTKDDIQSKASWGSDAGAWFANTAQYNTLDRNAVLQDRASGRALLADSLKDAATKGDTWVDTRSNALFANLQWHLTEAANLTTGLRVTKENRSTLDNKFVTADGAGGALNPVSVRGVQLGGFDSNKTTGALTAANTAAQLSLADQVANRYYGKTITATPGQAYNGDGTPANPGLTVAQKAQVAAAKAIRAAQIGQLSSDVISNYSDTLYTSVITPSYKFNDEFTGYASWQHGEKSGSGLNINFVSAPIKPEKTDSLEVGLKSFLFDKTLTLNVDAYYMKIRDYQTTVRALDEFQTQINLAPGGSGQPAYLTVQGNVPKVKAKGLEIDGVYSGITNTAVRFSGAYADARYVSFPNAARPDELGYLPSTVAFIDQSGSSLPGVAKWTFNLGAEYRIPVFDNKQFHGSFNTAYTSRSNNTDTLSSYGWVGGYSLTDAAIGIGTNGARNKFDLNLVVKNLFDKRPHETGWVSYSPNPYPRWVGITFSGSL